VRDAYLLGHPFCEVCGYVPDKRSVANDVHHIVPRHVDPSRILDPSNLITLCRKYGCHLRCGHFGNYSSYWNPNIRKIFPGIGSEMFDAEKEFKRTVTRRPAGGILLWLLGR
jgi:5-methylcytosine-specific restriction endonuclease McrA